MRVVCVLGAVGGFLMLAVGVFADWPMVAFCGGSAFGAGCAGQVAYAVVMEDD